MREEGEGGRGSDGSGIYISRCSNCRNSINICKRRGNGIGPENLKEKGKGKKEKRKGRKWRVERKMG